MCVCCDTYIYSVTAVCNDVDNDDITRNSDNGDDDDHVRREDRTEEQLLKEKLSNMELENNLLRDEVKLLNTELAEANRRAKEVQECKLLTVIVQ